MHCVYHLHLAKTAGTTINKWLDEFFHVCDAQPSDLSMYYRDEQVYSDVIGKGNRNKADNLSLLKQTDLTRWFTLLHTHQSVLAVIPDRFFVFTFLRNPVERVLSQYRDHARLQPHDYQNLEQSMREVIIAATKRSFRSVHAHLHENRFFRRVYEDHMCRMLINHLVSRDEADQMRSSDRARLAIEVLHERFDFIGITEKFDQSICLLSQCLKFPPPVSLGRLNPTKIADDHPEDVDIAANLSVGDQLLYDEGLKIFSDQRKKWGPCYTVENFEREHAEESLVKVQPSFSCKEAIFDMNAGFFGQGFHYRDAPGTDECARWMGPTREGTFFVRHPFPLQLRAKGGSRSVRIRLYIKGWVDHALRDTLQIFVDERQTEWHLGSFSGCDCIVTFEVKPTTAFFKIRLACAYARTDADMGNTTGDSRKKVLSLWKYSVECLP